MDISKFARKFYGIEKNKKSVREKDFDKKREEEPRLSNLFEPNGNFKINGYLCLLGCLIKVMLPLFNLLELIILSKWPFPKFVLKLLLSWFKKIAKTTIIDYVGDVVIYTTTDRKISQFEVRQSILKNSRLMLEKILEDKNYTDVIVAGHSLGTAVAYDTLKRIHTFPVYNKHYSKIKGLITFGSPLDKIGFYFRGKLLEGDYIRQQMLSNLQEFKRNKNVELPGDENFIGKNIKNKVHNETQENLKNINVKWINFYDRNDPIGGHLDLYNVDLNRELNMKDTDKKAVFGAAHVRYWYSDEMFEEIIKSFDKELNS